MFVCPKSTSLYFFRYLALAILSITQVQGFKSPSNMNISELLDLNGHIKAKPMSKLENHSHMNYSLLEPVLFEKLNNTKLSWSVFRVTTFFQFNWTKAARSILLHSSCMISIKTWKHYTQNLSLIPILIINHMMWQHILTYLALLNLCSGELADCKYQITQLTSRINNIFATPDQTGPKSTKKVIIHSPFNFLFGDPNSAEEFHAIKNNMVMLEENQDILSSQI